MQITIELSITPEELVDFSVQCDRPVTKESAELGLKASREQLTTRTASLLEAWRSKALDLARLADRRVFPY